MTNHLKLIEEQETILRNLKLNMQNLQDRIQYHKDQLNWLKETEKVKK